ncbi:hypothetical protein F9K94_16005 [Brucella tritici]|uniref:Uncharacterized protein n=1 Tax=Brucella tritici TaxID=94626 RepID=A0A7V7VSR5_9HYPH|nr:hypothetical protein F9K94_16005 [Brucella tritici]KXO75146.1 hypothetical protein AYJ56_11890 [Brucella anthropi]
MQRFLKGFLIFGAISTAFYLWIHFSSFPLSRQRRQGPMQNFAFPMQSLHEDKLKELFHMKESPFMQCRHTE